MVRGCNTGSHLSGANAGCTKHVYGVCQAPVARNSTAAKLEAWCRQGSWSRLVGALPLAPQLGAQLPGPGLVHAITSRQAISSLQPTQHFFPAATAVPPLLRDARW